MERSKLRHDRLWAAIDAIAARHGLSPSGLARRAGLDATAFNKSKRFTGDGRPRWPSTESIAKILAATGCELDDLARLIEDEPLPPPPGGDDASAFGFRDDVGEDAGAGAFRTFTVADDHALPVYRPGDVLVCSLRAAIDPGARVVCQNETGAWTARVVIERDGDRIRLGTLAEGTEVETVAADRQVLIARIAWVSQ